MAIFKDTTNSRTYSELLSRLGMESRPQPQDLITCYNTSVSTSAASGLHIVPLCVHKEIYDCAYEAQLLPFFDWGVLNPYRARVKVIDSIYELALTHMKNDSYEAKMMTWLPKNEPK